MDDLGSYLEVFSLVGDTPTSLGGYGYRRQTLEAAAQPSKKPYIPLINDIGGVTYVATPTLTVQKYLNLLQAPAGTSGVLDAKTLDAFKTWLKVFREKRQAPALKIVRMENVQSLEPTLAKRLFDNPRMVWMHPDVLSRLATLANKAAATGAKPAKTPTPVPAKPAAGVLANTLEIQKILAALGANIKPDGKFGPNTKAVYQAAAKKIGSSTLAEGKTGAAQFRANATTIRKLKAATAGAAPVSGGDMVANTEDIQSILKRLGAPPARLSDGKFGPTTQSLWQQSAQKRGLDPFIAQKGNLQTVAVRKDTYLRLRADADAKVAPQVATPDGGSLKLMPAGTTVQVPVAELAQTLGAVTQAKADQTGVRLDDVYKNVATQLGVDPRIESVDAQTVIVLKSSWDVIKARALQTKRAVEPKAPSVEDNIKAAMGQISKQSTASVSLSTLQNALNAAIQSGAIQIPRIQQPAWLPGMADVLVKMSKPADTVWREAWMRSFVPGKLVGAASVKVLPDVAAALNKLSSSFTEASKQEATRYKDFTEVNPAEIIARINGLSVTTKKFDRAGGAKELADAVKTFLDETKTSAPGGDLVRTDAAQKKVYVRNVIMQALAKAVTAAQARAQSTKKFRNAMVSNALKAASTAISVREFQEALRHMVMLKQAGKDTALYSKVSISGSFDAPTRAAFTEIARTATIGPSVQEYQRLLQQQLGPLFKANLVVEAQNQVWGAYLDQAVKKVGGVLSIAMLPQIAQKLAALAAEYRANISSQTRQAEVAAAQKKTLDAAVKKSTAILSLINVQQGLLQMIADKEISPTAGLRVTGDASTATKTALFELSGMIFPEGTDISDLMWANYLKQRGIVVSRGKAVKRAWAGASYLALPPPIADILARRAGVWIQKHGAPTNIQVVAFNNPSVIRVKAPKPEEIVISDAEAAKKVVESPQPAAKGADAEQQAALKAAQERATQEAAARSAAEQQAQAAQAAAEAARAQVQAAQQAAQEATRREAEARQAGAEREAETARQAAEQAQQQAADAQAAMARMQEAQMAAQAAAQATPTPTPTTPPAKAGMGGGLLFGLLGLGALAVLAKGDDKQEMQ